VSIEEDDEMMERDKRRRREGYETMSNVPESGTIEARSMTTLEDLGIVIRKRNESLQILSGSDGCFVKPWVVTGRGAASYIGA
jgi:hypothetical protein